MPKVISKKGDLLITVKGTVGKLAFLKLNKAHIARQIMAIRFQYPIDDRYIYFIIFISKGLLMKHSKSMIPGISRNDLLNLYIPLPPLSEQKRIVQRLNQILSKIDRLNKNVAKLHAIHQTFPH